MRHFATQYCDIAIKRYKSKRKSLAPIKSDRKDALEACLEKVDQSKEMLMKSKAHQM